MFVISIFIMSTTLNHDEPIIVNVGSNSNPISHSFYKDNQTNHTSHHKASRIQLPSGITPSISQQPLPPPLSESQQTIENPGIVPNGPSNVNKVVILTFEDGYQSQYAIAKPILDRYGYIGNFFVRCNKAETVTKCHGQSKFSFTKTVMSLVLKL